ncbi:MAG: hypothetical protein EOP11_11575, partial [Proteobacteria bacterium]
MDLGRNLETIRRQSGQWGEASALSDAQEGRVRRLLLGWLPAPSAHITELGFSASAAATLPDLLPPGGSYVSYERRPSRLAAGALAAGSARVMPLPNGAELEMATASQDLFLALFTLERLRMDELYM